MPLSPPTHRSGGREASPPPPLSSPSTKCLAVAASALYGGEAELLRTAFDRFDTLRSGSLDYDQTLKALRYLGFSLSNGYRRAVLGPYGASGRLTTPQFAAVARECAEAADDALRHESCWSSCVRILTNGPITLEEPPPEYGNYMLNMLNDTSAVQEAPRRYAS